MCGLVGVAGVASTEAHDLFTELLIANTIRGAHSTGIASVHSSGKVDVHKRTGVPHFLLWNEEYAKFAETQKHGVVCRIGHNRHATQGTINNDNAHPFQHGNITLAHNGTVYDHALKDIRKGAKSIFQTDSETITEGVNRLGIDKVWHEIEYGAAALTYWNTANKSMHLIRDDKRPLFYAFFNAYRNMVWASEAPMLEWIFNRNKVALDGDEIFEAKPDHLYRFSWEPAKGIQEFVRKIEKPKYKHWEKFSKHFDNEEDFYNSYGTPTVTRIVPNNSTIVKPANDAFKKENWDNDTPEKKGIELEHFIKHFGECSFCNRTLLEEDHKAGVVLSSDTYVCEGCVSDAADNNLSLQGLTRSY
jgi:predicted glutamine amidotransferase